ncbi:MAG: LD-carboxypeptidase [Bacteroidetes bacterium]|nr:LD-carboxypeptidase [Bacteroidota bacterium]
MITVPAYLQEGDLILLIATARKRSRESVQPAIDILTGWGLRVETGLNVFKEHHQFAGSDEERARDLQWALNHKTAKAILVTGGGYGTLRIIDSVSFKGMVKYPKWFIGYSDVTVIHNRLHNLKMASLHATMAFQFPKHTEATHSLKKALFGEKINYNLKPNAFNRKGKAKGIIIGGNLSLLFAVSGSIDDISTRGKILFLEDLDEQLYHLDRMMLQLKRSGKLKHLKGLVVGGMSEMKDNAVPYGNTPEQIIMDAVKDYNYPVCFEFPAGHIDDNRAIYFGKKVTMDITAKKAILKYI